MYSEAAVAAQRLVQASDLPWLHATELVQSFCRLAQRATASPWARVELEPGGAGRPLEAALEAVSGPRPQPTSGPWRAALQVAVPVRYQGRQVGSIHFLAIQEDERAIGLVTALARQLAYQVKRLEIEAEMRTRFGRELHLVGASAALGHFDRFLEQAARSTLPAFLVGEPGAETEALAYALHLAGPGREHRFIQAHCAALTSERLEAQLGEYLRAAAGGTLLLSRIDELDGRCQRLLCQTLDSGELDSATIGGPPVRLIATSSRSLATTEPQRVFYRPLLDRLDILHFALSPLRERREDVVPMFLHSLRKLAIPANVALSEAVQSCLRQYDWPGDALELWQTAARVALPLEQGTVEIGHLELHAPQVVAPSRGRGASAVSTVSAPPANPQLGRPARSEAAAAPLETPAPQPQLTPGSYHPCIERAMSYTYEHFARKLPLSEVAAHAHASVSHLAHLLRQETGMTFTQILTAIRVEHSKRLLRERPWESITTIAGAAGFSELRHFERTFKALVGLTPKGFRRAQAEGLSTPTPSFLLPLRGRSTSPALATLNETPQ